jgi:hypothetical protein
MNNSAIKKGSQIRGYGYGVFVDSTEDIPRAVIQCIVKAHGGGSNE